MLKVKGIQKNEGRRVKGTNRHSEREKKKEGEWMGGEESGDCTSTMKVRYQLVKNVYSTTR